MSIPAPDRREFLTVAGAAAAGLALLRDAVAADAGPAAQVRDSAGDLKLTALKATVVGTKVFVRLSTNRGLTGWGEITGTQPAVAAALAESLFELLDGENPTRIEHLWQKVYRSHRDIRGGAFLTHTLSAIDMALWDIAGRAWGVPVHRLLGGPVRDRIRVYPTAKAIKVGPGGPREFSSTPAELESILKQIAAARAKVGPDGAVMFDAHCCLPPPMMVQLGGMLQPADLLFLEEPAVPGNIEVFRRIRQACRVPLASGERDRTIWEVLPYLQHGVVDVLQPDCGQTGGISQMRKIAALAEAFHVPLAPHCTMSPLGLTASLHAAAATPLFLIHEAYTDGHIMPAGVANATWTVDAKTGTASIPEGPGLGVEIDEKRMAEVAAEPRKRFRWPVPKLKDGSVSDY